MCLIYSGFIAQAPRNELRVSLVPCSLCTSYKLAGAGIGRKGPSPILTDYQPACTIGTPQLALGWPTPANITYRFDPASSALVVFLPILWPTNGREHIGTHKDLRY